MSEKPDNKPNADPKPTTSPSGSPIYRHQQRKRRFQLAYGENEALALIDRHITRYIGSIEWVHHELASDLVHIDIHVINPTHSRNYYKLVTSGMSDLPMHVPDGAKHLQYAELMLCLPPNWPLTNAALEDPNNYWPMRWLRLLARFPHQYETWFGVGHTIPNGNPAQPLSDQTSLCGMIFAKPALFKDQFAQLTVNAQKTIHFLSVIPVYQSEIALKLDNGANALFERFAANNVTELLIQNRDVVS
jgi:hypothetical protein